MNILIVSQYYYPDPFRLHELAEGLVERGNEVTVLTGTPNYVSESMLKSRGIKKGVEWKNNVKVVRVATRNRKSGMLNLTLSYITYVFNATMKSFSMKDDYDVILVYQLSPILMTIPAFILRKKNNKKICLYCLDLWPESMVGGKITHKSILYKIMRGISIKIYNSVDSIAVSSKQFKNYFSYDLKLKHKTYEYIPQFAEDIYTSINPIKHDGINYVFAGNIGEAQSVETIIKAATLTKDTNIKWHIIGDGSKLELCKQLAKENFVEENVIFYGRKPVEEISQYYSIADAMIVTLTDNPTISFTLPGKVQSYMAAGLPLLVSANGETAEVINKANCGLCCNANDYYGLATNAKKLINLDRALMGKNAKRYYFEYFTKEKCLDSLEIYLKNK